MKTLENYNIRLRSLEPEDIDFLYQTENFENYWEISNTITPYSKYILEQYIKNSHQDIFTTKQVRFVIEHKENKTIIGLIDLFDYDPIHLRAGIGIIIKQNEQRKSYAYNAVKLLIAYSFNILKLNQLYCNVATDNEAGLNLFQKLNFKITGKKEQWINGMTKFQDIFFLQLINNK
jgi:diamine N-acetyltransferase